MGALSALAVVLFFIAFATTKERVQPPKGQKTPFKQDFADLISNTPWLLIGAATVFQLMYICIRGGSIAYYIEYFVKDQSMTLFGKDYDFTYKGLTSSFLMAGTVLTIIGVVLTPRISKIFGKSKTYACLLGVAGISSGLFCFLGRDDIILMFVLQLITSFSVGPVSVLQWAIYTDAADYSEWKTGRRATALVMSASLFALKLGIALGVAGLAWILAAYGYEPNQEQTEKGLLGIRMVMSIYPHLPSYFRCNWHDHHVLLSIEKTYDGAGRERTD